MNFEHAQSLLKIAFEGYDGDKVDIIRVLNEMLVKSQQTCEDVVHVADNDSEPVIVKGNKREMKDSIKTPTKFGVGSEKCSKKKNPKPIVIYNKIKNRGVRNDCCMGIKWEFEGKKTYTPRTLSQCRNEPTDTGLCQKCEKKNTKNGGWLRNGRLEMGMSGDEVLQKGFFGESANSFTPHHQKWCKDFSNEEISIKINYI